MATTLLVSPSNADEALCKTFYPSCVSWNNKEVTMEHLGTMEVFQTSHQKMFVSLFNSG